MFWECDVIQQFWHSVEEWLHDNFIHCGNVCFSKELVIAGVAENVRTDRIFDLLLIIAKYHIFVSKIKNTNPNLNLFINQMKNMYQDEKYYCSVNHSWKKIADWMLYQSFFN